MNQFLNTAFFVLIGLSFVSAIFSEKLLGFSIATLLFSYILGLLFLHDNTGHYIVTYPYYHTFNFCIMLCLYMSIGALYSIIQWYRYNKQCLSKLRDSIPDIITEIKRHAYFNNTQEIQRLYKNKFNTEITVEQADLELSFYEEVVLNKNIKPLFNTKLLVGKLHNKLVLDYVPTLSQMKSMVFEWILCWPFLMIHALIQDPLKWLLEITFNSIKKILLNIQKRVYKEYDI